MISDPPPLRAFISLLSKTGPKNLCMVIAVDFFTVDRVWIQRLYVRSVIEIGSRRVHSAGCTAYPDEAWVKQQTRQVAWRLVEREETVRFLIRDRDRKFTSSFDAVFQAQDMA
jgi:putative transposase